MENRDKQNPDVSKQAQAQQPRGERSQRSGESQPDAGKTNEDPSSQSPSSETGQAGFGENRADTTTEQRSDVEGSSLGQSGGASTGQASDIEGSSFVGSEGSKDTSSELVEDENKDRARGDGE